MLDMGEDAIVQSILMKINSFCAVLPSARAAHFIIRMLFFPIFEARNLVLIASVPGHC